MAQSTLESTVAEIVSQADRLRLRHVPEYPVHVSYCAIFCQNEDQFNALNGAAIAAGSLAETTPTGPVYIVAPMQTAAGPLRIVKIRKPDPTRPERGDADFALKDYDSFKTANLARPGFKLIKREHFEMLELVDSAFDVRVYFSNPPVERHPNIKRALAAQG